MIHCFELKVIRSFVLQNVTLIWTGFRSQIKLAKSSPSGVGFQKEEGEPMARAVGCELILPILYLGLPLEEILVLLTFGSPL